MKIKILLKAVLKLRKFKVEFIEVDEKNFFSPRCLASWLHGKMKCQKH